MMHTPKKKFDWKTWDQFLCVFFKWVRDLERGKETPHKASEVKHVNSFRSEVIGKHDDTETLIR